MLHAVLAVAALSLGGCLSGLLDGPSSAQRKDQILKESVLSAAPLVTMKRGPDHLKTNGNSIRPIFHQISGLVIKVHREQCAEIAGQLSASLSCDLVPDFELADLGGPYVGIDGTTTLRMDPEVVRVVIREAVLGVLRETGVPEFKRPSRLSESHSDDELLLAFSELWREVQAAPVSKRDEVKFAEAPTEAQAEEQQAWDRLKVMRAHVDTVKSEMAGGVAFLLAHALGHQVLGHTRLEPATAEDLRRAEAEADTYAARLLTAIFTSSALSNYENLRSQSQLMENISLFYALPSRLTEAVELAWYPARTDLPAVVPPTSTRPTVIAGEYERLLQDVKYREKSWTKLTIGWE